MAKLHKTAIAKLAAGSLIDTLGIEIQEAGGGSARARMRIEARHLAPNGFLHAATIVALADSCCGYGTFADLPEGAEAFTTAELKSNHMGTAREGAILCKAIARHQGRSTQVWDAEVMREDAPDAPIALFRCTQIVLWPR